MATATEARTARAKGASDEPLVSAKAETAGPSNNKKEEDK